MLVPLIFVLILFLLTPFLLVFVSIFSLLMLVPLIFVLFFYVS
jgi:hypothetical protein